jgi:hypothetical protein
MLEKSGLEISEDEADRIKTSLRKEASQRLSVLASSNYVFIAEYRERIETVKYLIKRANELFNQPAPIKTVQKTFHNPDGTTTVVNESHTMDNSNLKRRVLVDIANMESMLMEMYDAMPIVKQVMELKVGKMTTTTATTNNETSVNVP